jgi:hypothetical protein
MCKKVLVYLLFSGLWMSLMITGCATTTVSEMPITACYSQTRSCDKDCNKDGGKDVKTYKMHVIGDCPDKRCVQ